VGDVLIEGPVAGGEGEEDEDGYERPASGHSSLHGRLCAEDTSLMPRCGLPVFRTVRGEITQGETSDRRPTDCF